MAQVGARGGLAWAVAQRALAGEVVSGDLAVCPDGGDEALFGVIDGAGHGVEAAVAAEAASAAIARHAALPLDAVIARCHDALRSTRGAALSLARLDPSGAALSWCGVGNVEGAVLCRHDARGPKREALLLRNGVVGYRYAAPRVATLPVHDSDLLILVTDGVRSGFVESAGASSEPAEVADSILRAQARDTDDALVFVARLGAWR